MHVEKGGFESTIDLLLDITSKTKDGLNTHKDLQALGIREDLHAQKRLKVNRSLLLLICEGVASWRKVNLFIRSFLWV
jgi:hypothetical protein